ncbi:dephospho-CoA kinase [Alteromonas sp. V450]|uniref:dephospho-CoA kinase n=1 Tax=Alteromonas sp. V450 TaxID=1912139 RepID=UPI0008FF6B9E|nr:dephospho-CoA kinase [Alteromonas sp. V450]OJF69024.1 dephospho-CoA kinase [Alteromonas sp. V450]
MQNVDASPKKRFVVGLTGGIGSGKSAATCEFERLGIDIVDADVVARDVVDVGTQGLSEIEMYFGKGILLDDGTLNRAALRDRVFSNSDAKEWLNNLLHPLIRARMQHLIELSTSQYCILSVPLLVENKLTTLCDKVVVVDCPTSTQLERAMLRDGSSEKTIKSIMASQASRETRLNAADYVLHNNTTLSALADQVNTLHATLLTLSAND